MKNKSSISGLLAAAQSAGHDIQNVKSVANAPEQAEAPASAPAPVAQTEQPQPKEVKPQVSETAKASADTDFASSILKRETKRMSRLCASHVRCTRNSKFCHQWRSSYRPSGSKLHWSQHEAARKRPYGFEEEIHQGALKSAKAKSRQWLARLFVSVLSENMRKSSSSFLFLTE